jgi:chitodextrinase
LLATALAASILSLSVASQATAATNLALKRPAVASSSQSSSFPPMYVDDGSLSTRWSSTQAVDPQWIYVDLGASYPISQVVLNWEVAYAKSFQIQVSNDATTWTSIYSTTTGTGGTQTLNVSGTGRYVRMYGTVRGTIYGYSLWEMSVYGATTADSTPPTVPANLTAIPGNGQVALSWSASSDNGGGDAIAGYHIYRNGTQVGSTTATSYTDTGLTNGTSYSYTVSAYDQAGNLSARSSAVSATPVASTSSAVVHSVPLGPSAPTGGWKLEYADAFGALLGTASGRDNTVWPSRITGNCTNNPGFNSNEIEVFNCSQVSTDANGLELKCNYAPGIVSGKNYNCGAVTTGGSGSTPAEPAGYKLFQFTPGQGQEWALQIVTKFPPNTGEADPGWWASTPTWKWEWDMFEAFGGEAGKGGGWCASGHYVGTTDPTLAYSTSPWNGPGGENDLCHDLGFDPSAGVHTYTTVLFPDRTLAEWIDGRRVTFTGASAKGSNLVTGEGAIQNIMGNLILSYALRGTTDGNPDPYFTSGTRLWTTRSIAVYENASANNAKTSCGSSPCAPYVAPGTAVSP